MSETDALIYEEVATFSVDTPDTPLITDAVPPLSDSFEYSCDNCGRELKYAGRGRKPSKCRKGEGCRGGETPVSRGARVQTNGRWQQPLAEALTQNFVGIGVVVYALNNFDGQTIISGSPRLAESLVGVAQTNESVRRGLEAFVNGGAWAQVALAAAAIALPIMQNHNLGPRFSVPASFAAPAGATA